jgi:DNA invertase Pin-like site-specific DNA recombinase
MDKPTIYAAFLCRVSTGDQSNQSQVDTLKQIIKLSDENIIVKPEHIFEEKISGYTDTRKSLEKLKQAVEKNELNRIYCIEFTRLSRKPQTLINEYEYFVRKKIPIYFVHEDCWTLDKDTINLVVYTREKLYGAALWGGTGIAENKAKDNERTLN